MKNAILYLLCCCSLSEANSILLLFPVRLSYRAAALELTGNQWLAGQDLQQQQFKCLARLAVKLCHEKQMRQRVPTKLQSRLQLGETLQRQLSVLSGKVAAELGIVHCFRD